MRSSNCRKESIVCVEKCAVFCCAKANLCALFGCTLRETELTCQRWLTKKRLRAGASSLSLAATAEFSAMTTSVPSLKFATRT